MLVFFPEMELADVVISNACEKSYKISQSLMLPGREAILSLIKTFGQAFEMTNSIITRKK